MLVVLARSGWATHSVRSLIIGLTALAGIARGEIGQNSDKNFGGKRRIIPSVRCLPAMLGNSWGAVVFAPISRQVLSGP